LYDAEGSVTVSYEGILPDLFREGQGVVVQGTLEEGQPRPGARGAGTPGEILYGKRETQQLPAVGQRLRVGGMVMPGSVRRDPDSLKVNFSLYDAEGSVTVSYEGILPDLFREGQGVVVQGTLEKGNHVLAHEVLAKHDENYTPPEVEKAMQENHRRPQRADKDTSS
ncbi:cytochrome c maturation protein CcmE, partial [Salmonella enterica]